MITLTNTASRIAKGQIAWVFLIAFLSFTVAVAQDTDQPSQETINKRIEEIFKVDLQIGVSTSPEGYRLTTGKVYYSPEEGDEIKKYGDKAIAPLAAYFDKSDFRAQQLAIRFLEVIGGPRVIKILSNVAEKSSSEGIRYRALLTLAQYPWPDIADVVRRIATSDGSDFMKSEARKIVEKNDKPAQ